MNPQHPATDAADLAGLLDELDLRGEPGGWVSPAAAHGAPPTAHGTPPTAHGAPPTAHDAPPTAHGAPPTGYRGDLDGVLSSRLALRFEEILARDERAIAAGTIDTAGSPPLLAGGEPGLFERALAANPREQILGRLAARPSAEPELRALAAAVRSSGRDVLGEIEEPPPAEVGDDRALLEAERIAPEPWGTGDRSTGLAGVLSQRLRSTVPGIEQLLAPGLAGRSATTSAYEALARSIAASAATVDRAVDLLAALGGIVGTSPALSWLITAITTDTASPQAARRSAGALGLVAAAARQPDAAGAQMRSPVVTPAKRPSPPQDAEAVHAAVPPAPPAGNAPPTWAQLGSLDAVAWLGAQLSVFQPARGTDLASPTATALPLTAPRLAPATGAKAARTKQLAGALAAWAADHQPPPARVAATPATVADTSAPGFTGGIATSLATTAAAVDGHATMLGEAAMSSSRGAGTDEDLARLRAAGDLAGLVEALARRGAQALDDGDIDAAVDLLDEAAAVAEAVRRPAHAALALLGAACALRSSGRIDHAVARARRATTLAPGGPARVAALTGLGECQRAAGELEDAAHSYALALAQGRTMGLRPFHQAALLRRRADVLRVLGRIDEATTDLSAAVAAYDAANADEPRHDTLVERAAALVESPAAACRAALDAAQAAAATSTLDAPRAELALLEATRARRANDLPGAIAWAERARHHALTGNAPLTYAAAALATADLKERAGDRLGAYTSLAVAWVTLADRLGADIAAAWLHPALAGARSRWGDPGFQAVMTAFAANLPDRR